MTSTRAFLFGAIIVCALFLFLAPAMAQEGQQCAFGSDRRVAVQISSPLTESVPDTPVGLHISMTNHSDEEVFDGVLYLRVRGGSPEVTVDAFEALQSIDIAAGETVESDVVWRTPLGMMGGTYRIEAYVLTPEAPFVPLETSDASAHTLAIHGAGVGPYISREGITVDGRVYDDAFVLDPSATSTTIAIDVVNPLNTPFEGRVVWRIFERGLSPLAEPTAEYESELQIHPNSTIFAARTFEQLSSASYYVEAELTNDATRSRLGIFLARDADCGSTASGREQDSSYIVLLATVGILLGGGFLYFLWRND